MVRVHFSVDFLIDIVSVVDCFVGLPSEVPHQVTHWHLSFVVLD